MKESLGLEADAGVDRRDGGKMEVVYGMFSVVGACASVVFVTGEEGRSHWALCPSSIPSKKGENAAVRFYRRGGGNGRVDSYQQSRIDVSNGFFDGVFMGPLRTFGIAYCV